MVRPFLWAISTDYTNANTARGSWLIPMLSTPRYQHQMPATKLAQEIGSTHPAGRMSGRPRH